MKNRPIPILRSGSERMLEDYLKYAGVKTSHRRLFGYDCDIFLPKYGVGVEYNGSFYHKSYPKDADSKVSSYAHSKCLKFNRFGVPLISIYDYEWWTNTRQIKQYLSFVLGLSESNLEISRPPIIKPLPITNNLLSCYSDYSFIPFDEEEVNKLETYGVFNDKEELVFLFSGKRKDLDSFSILLHTVDYRYTFNSFVCILESIISHLGIKKLFFLFNADKPLILNKHFLPDKLSDKGFYTENGLEKSNFYFITCDNILLPYSESFKLQQNPLSVKCNMTGAYEVYTAGYGEYLFTEQNLEKLK